MLISDGGDESSAPSDAARELEKRRIRLVVAGVGDRSSRATVPTSEVDASPIVYQGRAVTAPLDEDALQSICKASARCTYAALPSAAFERAVLDTRLLFAGSDAHAGSAVRVLLAMGAAILLAGESLLRRFVR